YDQDRLIERSLRLFEPAQLSLGEHILGILQNTTRGHKVIGRHGNAYFVIAERQCEFTGSKKLFVLPSVHVVVNTHPRKELRDGIEVVAVFREVLHAAALSEDVAVYDIKGPIDVIHNFFTALQRL